MGCSNKEDIVSFEDFIEGNVEDGEKVRVIGKVAFFDKVDIDDTKLDLEGPTQVISLVNEDSIGLKVYNELEETDVEVEKDDEITVEGIFHNTGKKPTNVIKATKIKE